MAIYLDANVLWSWRTFAEADRLALSIVAHQLGQAVFIPSIAMREAEERYRRDLEAIVERFERTQRDVERRFSEQEVSVHIEPWPDIDDMVAIWLSRLRELAVVLPLHDDDAHAAFDREITGTLPAKPREKGKPGRGGRDVAIWLTIARHHLAASEEGYLVTSDRDFADDDGLHARLRTDIQAVSHPIHVYADINAFLARLGTPTAGREITLGELEEFAATAVVGALEGSVEISRKVWDELKPEMRYSTQIESARPVEVLDQRRYEQSDDAVVVVNARWDLSSVRCCYQQHDTTDPETWTVPQGAVDVSANVQVFLEQRDGALGQAQFIAAQFTSDTTLFFGADGQIMRMTTLRDE
jgi:hypothetical protein